MPRQGLLMSPAAMRAVAMGLLERAAETEIANRKAKTDASNIVPFGEDNSLCHMHNALRQEYPLQALASIAAIMYRQRRKRNEVFGIDVSNEPAWDMLLDLFVQRTRGKQISVTSACHASAGSQTTALRYLTMLEEKGLVRRQNDPLDKRVTNVEMTARAYRQMVEYLSGINNELTNASEDARATFMILK